MITNTVIGPRSRIQGVIRCPEILEIFGNINGAGSPEAAVNCDSTVIIQPSGFVLGDIHTHGEYIMAVGSEHVGDVRSGNAKISGRNLGEIKTGGACHFLSGCHQDGNIEAREVRIQKGCTVIGTIRTAYFFPEPGADFRGTLELIETEEKPMGLADYQKTHEQP